MVCFRVVTGRDNFPSHLHRIGVGDSSTRTLYTVSDIIHLTDFPALSNFKQIFIKFDSEKKFKHTPHLYLAARNRTMCWGKHLSSCPYSKSYTKHQPSKLRSLFASKSTIAMKRRPN